MWTLVFLSIISVTGTEAFINDICSIYNFPCFQGYHDFRIFTSLLPPWDTDNVDIAFLCRQSYEAYHCLRRQRYFDCPRLLPYVAQLQAKHAFVCDGFNTHLFTPYTAMALFNSQCARNTTSHFDLRVALSPCRETFFARQRLDTDYCLLNQEFDACVINEIRNICQDDIFRNFFETVWFAQVPDVFSGQTSLGGDEEYGPCYARTSQLYDYALQMRTV